MDSINLNKNGITPLQSEFQKINDIADNKSLWAEIAHLTKLGTETIFNINVVQDDKNSSKLIMAIEPAPVSMRDMDNYLINDPRTERIREKFLEYAQQLFIQMGEPEDLAMKNARIVLETETQLAKSFMTSIEKHDVSAQYNKKSIDELKKLAPDINWNTFFEKINAQPDSIMVFEPLFIKHVNDMSKTLSLDKIKKLGKPVDRTVWDILTPQTVMAAYRAGNNEIMFCAAILEPPFFDPNRSDAMNYGAIGTVIGHELTHGFDDQGSQYDAEGNLHQWITKEDSTRFHEKLQVIINQFNNYTIDSLKLDGNLAVSENTADLGGVTIAFCAMENNLKKHPEGLIDGFTPEQRFFISYAQLGRQNITRESLRKVIKSGYAPFIYRVNGPLSDMPEFYKAFNVKPGDGMFRTNDIRAIIW